MKISLLEYVAVYDQNLEATAWLPISQYSIDDKKDFMNNKK